MNFTLKSDWVAETIRTAIEKDAGYGRSDAGKGRRVQVEFVSANPTGPLHMGHGRGAAVGDITASLLDFAGWDVEREYYTNDAGLQMELLGKSAQARYFEALGRADEAPMPEDGYQGDYMNDIAKIYVEKYGDSLAEKPLEETLEFFSQETGKMVLGLIKKDLEDFGVKFDVWFSEKSLYENNAVEPAMEALKERGYAYEEEGALWFRSTLFGDDKDRVLIRSNGMPTYFTSDVAYLKNKYDRGFERLVYVWGADHHGYVPRIKSVNKAFGYPDDGIEVLLIQMVNLLRDGKPVQMSKRAGTIVTLREIMDEVGRDAARLFFVIRRCDSTVDFDLELAKKASSENPVFYIQYAHARICSILRELDSRGVEMPKLDELDVSLIADQSELNLAKAISRFPDEVAKAAAEYAPAPHSLLRERTRRGLPRLLQLAARPRRRGERHEVAHTSRGSGARHAAQRAAPARRLRSRKNVKTRAGAADEPSEASMGRLRRGGDFPHRRAADLLLQGAGKNRRARLGARQTHGRARSRRAQDAEAEAGHPLLQHARRHRAPRSRTVQPRALGRQNI